MKDRIFIKPAVQDDKPLLVRKPVNGHLAATGEWMPVDSYWTRRLTDGDVVRADPPAEEPAAAPAPELIKPEKPAAKAR